MKYNLYLKGFGKLSYYLEKSVSFNEKKFLGFCYFKKEYLTFHDFRISFIETSCRIDIFALSNFLNDSVNKKIKSCNFFDLELFIKDCLIEFLSEGIKR